MYTSHIKNVIMKILENEKKYEFGKRIKKGGYLLNYNLVNYKHP